MKIEAKDIGVRKEWLDAAASIESVVGMNGEDVTQRVRVNRKRVIAAVLAEMVNNPHIPTNEYEWFRKTIMKPKPAIQESIKGLMWDGVENWGTKEEIALQHDKDVHSAYEAGQRSK